MTIWSYHQRILHNTSPAHSSQPPQISAYSVSFSGESQLLLSSPRGHGFTRPPPAAHSLHLLWVRTDQVKLRTAIPSGVEQGEMSESWGSRDDPKCCAGSLLTRHCYIQGCTRHTEQRQLPSRVANQTALHQRASMHSHIPSSFPFCLARAPYFHGTSLRRGYHSNQMRLLEEVQKGRHKWSKVKL